MNTERYVPYSFQHLIAIPSFSNRARRSGNQVDGLSITIQYWRRVQIHWVTKEAFSFYNYIEYIPEKPRCACVSLSV